MEIEAICRRNNAERKRKFLLVFCMRRRSSVGDLDLEIEATYRRNNAKRRRKILQEREVTILEEPCSLESSSIFPPPRESHTGASEAHKMAEDQPRRVTLEDYSSSTVLVRRPTSVPDRSSSIER